MAFVPFASWNSRSITHLANYLSRSLPMNSSDESNCDCALPACVCCVIRAALDRFSLSDQTRLKGLLDVERPMVSSALGLLLNAMGGVLFSAMALMHWGGGLLVSGEKVSTALTGIWLGIDLAWDAYIGLGTICFAVAVLRHPRFGRVFAFSGLAIAVG